MRAALSAVCLSIDCAHLSYVYVSIDECQINASQHRNLLCVSPHFAYQFLIDFVICQRVYDHTTQFVEIETVPANAMHESLDTFVAHARNELLLYT